MLSGTSIGSKAAALVSIVLLSTAGIIAVDLVGYERRFLLEEGEKRADSLAKTLAAGAMDPLLVDDDLRLGPITYSLTRDSDVLYAYVVDHEGLVAAHSDSALVGSAASALAERGSDESVLEASAPVVVEGTTVGSAVVGLDIAFVDRAVRETAKGLLLPLGLGILLALGSILFLTEMYVQRIARLEEAVRVLGTGDLSVRAEVSGHDELARLARGFNSMVAQLREAQAEIRQGVTETVSALASTIEVNDTYTRGHCERVGRGARALAARLGVEEEDLRQFELAAILHDIGKIGVGTQVLSKQSRLDDGERLKMQEHVVLGARILENVSFLTDIALYVRHHHEDWDGRGYPDGLSGEAIPLASRVIHVVDAYDAMTSSRPYRSALSHDEAMKRIVAGRGDQFDPMIVDAFVSMAAEGAVETIRRQVEEGLAA